MAVKLSAVIGVVLSMLLTAGCSGGGSKDYDIGPIFPLSDPAAKCAKYQGDASGSGITASCLVTKDECEKAAKDWAAAMENVPDALRFSCDG